VLRSWLQSPASVLGERTSRCVGLLSCWPHGNIWVDHVSGTWHPIMITSHGKLGTLAWHAEDALNQRLHVVVVDLIFGPGLDKSLLRNFVIVIFAYDSHTGWHRSHLQTTSR
jgi:hypothetical protein